MGTDLNKPEWPKGLLVEDQSIHNAIDRLERWADRTASERDVLRLQVDAVADTLLKVERERDSLRVQKGKLIEALKEWLYEVPDGRFRPHHWKAIIYKSREALAEAEGRE